MTIAKAAGLIVMPCPYCLALFSKDEECDHVECYNCKNDFCFKCSCKRKPTLIHGNHYHRPDCEHHTPYDKEDIYEEDCDECKEKGEGVICARPNNLEESDIPESEKKSLNYL